MSPAWLGKENLTELVQVLDSVTSILIGLELGQMNAMATSSNFRIGVAATTMPGEAGLFTNRYGHFDPATDEFVITDVLTPRPWTNVMSNGRYGLVVSQMGGGFSWLDNSQLSRITRWEQDLAIDSYGRWMYVVDASEDKVYSTTFAPVREAALVDEARHGLGYSVFYRRHARFETTQTVFVSESSNCEHAIVEVTNLSAEPLDLVVGSYLEWFLGGQGEWHREFHRLFVSVAAEGNVLSAWKRTGLEEGTRQAPEASMVAFAAVTGVDDVEWFADKARWLGPAGRLDRPDALTRPDITSEVTGRWDDPVAAFRSSIRLLPGESRRYALTIGAGEVTSPKSLREVFDELNTTRSVHRKRAHKLEVRTNDQALDLMVNSWLPHQADIGRIKARCAYYQQGGAFGYRDQLQDSLMLLDTEPDRTLEQIHLHAEAMYEDGGVRHWWHPNSQIFAGSKHSDTCLWLAHGVLDAIDETGDLAFLSHPHGYINRQTQAIGESGSLLDHCERGIGRFLDRRSARGLPLLGAGDWNDGLSHAGIDGKGESVWLAMFGFQILGRLSKVYERIGDGASATRMRAEAESLRKAVETYAWDGEWYIAGTNDEGRPFGSNECREGKIFLNPQTWAAITGIGDPSRIKTALQAVRENLVQPYGALLLSPAYSEVDPYIGYITRYAPGLRENGGVYSHASTWAVQAFAQSGDADTAISIFRSMLPPLRAQQNADAYQAEPYVMPGNVDGPDSPYEGRAGWTWYTGSAAWMRRIALQWLIGVRPSFDGLVIDPSFGQELGPVTMRRPFRGDVFDITIEDAKSLKMVVDGQLMDRGPVPASGLNQVRTIGLLAD